MLESNSLEKLLDKNIFLPNFKSFLSLIEEVFDVVAYNVLLCVYVL